MTKPRITPQHFAAVYETFQAPISKFDCGKKCAPLNGGEPVCCSTENAIPVVHKAEFDLLKSRTKLWSRFKPHDASSRKIVEELPDNCRAIHCKGARHCERDNRTIACRSFPFFPYITRAGEFIGLAHYWIFEETCWLPSNLGVVEPAFVREMVAAFESIFMFDPEEFSTMKDHSASMRRVFTRRKRIIPLLGREGGYFKVMPRTGEVRAARLDEFKRVGAYASEAAYIRAVKKAKGTLPPRPPGGYLAP